MAKLEVLFLNPLKSFPTMPRSIKPTLNTRQVGYSLSGGMQHDVERRVARIRHPKEEVEKLAGIEKGPRLHSPVRKTHSSDTEGGPARSRRFVP